MTHIIVKEEYYHKLQPVQDFDNEPWKLQIPTSIVRSPELNENEFTTVCILKYAYDLNLRNQAQFSIENTSTIEIPHTQLKNYLGLSDNRTLKDYLKRLFELGLIFNLIDKFPKNKPLKIQLNVELLNQKPFTQLPINILKLLNKIHTTGMRLLYYYESYTNRDEDKPAYPSQEKIKEEIGISENTCCKYNQLMSELDILKYVTYPVVNTYQFNVNDKPICKRPNNTYEVLINNLKTKHEF